MAAPHERLDAWAAGHALTIAVYRATQAFPTTERYGLTAQLRRAAAAIPTNIAEGAAKHGPREFRRFLDIALGSLGELTYLLLLARDLALISDATWRALEQQRDSAGKLTWRLYKAIKRKAEKT